MDLHRRELAGGLVRGGDGEGEHLPALVADAVAVVVLPVRGIEEGLRVGLRILVPRHVPHVRPRALRHELVGDGPAPVGGDLQHAAAVDGRRDRLPHGTVAEDRLLRPDVEEQGNEVVGREAVQDRILQGAGALRVLAREPADTVDLAAGKGEQGFALVRIEPEDDPIEIRRRARGASPIEGAVPDQRDLTPVHLAHAERAATDGMHVERLAREVAVGDVREEVGGKQRDRRAPREGAVHIRQGEAHGLVRDPLDVHAAERVAVLTDVAAILKELDGVDHVVGGDRLPVLPERVLADVEGPDLAVRLGAEGGREIGDDRAGLVVPGEPAERQPDDVIVDIGRGDDRVEVLRDPGNALDIRAAVGRIACPVGAAVEDRDDARDDEESQERDDDELVAGGHLARVCAPRPHQRDQDEDDDEDDRQSKERSLEAPAAAIRR